MRIVSRNSSPNLSQASKPQGSTPITTASTSIPPPPPLHPQPPAPPPLAPSFGHASSMASASMVGPSNIIIHHSSNNLNPFPFVPSNQYGLLASAMNSVCFIKLFGCKKKVRSCIFAGRPSSNDYRQPLRPTGRFCIAEFLSSIFYGHRLVGCSIGVRRHADLYFAVDHVQTASAYGMQTCSTATGSRRRPICRLL